MNSLFCKARKGSLSRFARHARLGICVHLSVLLCTHVAFSQPVPTPAPSSSSDAASPSPNAPPSQADAPSLPEPPGAGASAQSNAPSPQAPPPATPGPRNTKAKGTREPSASNRNASAPEPPSPEPSPEDKTIEVRVIGAGADALQKIPGSGQLITTKDIARAQPNDISELLRRVPGLVVRQEQGAGLRLDISVRGLDGTRSRRVLVLEDGVPVAINPYGEPDLYYSPPFERVRGIEVVKGSGSILFGPQTIGGVVQLLTHAPPDSRQVHVFMNAGAPGQFELLGRYGDAHGDVRYLAQVFGKRGDGVRGESYYATDAFAKLVVPISARSELAVKIGFHDEAASSTDVGLTRSMFENDPRRPTIAPFDQVHVQRFDGSLQHRLWLSENITLSTLAYATSTSRLWRRQDYERIGRENGNYERIVGDVTEDYGAIYFLPTNTIRDRSYSVIGVEPRLSFRFKTREVAHSLEVGARFLSETSHRASRAGDSPLSEAGALLTDEQSGTLALAGYVQDRLAFTDYLLVTPGFRVEYASSKRSLHRALVAGEPKDVSIEGASDLLAAIPGIGVVIGTPQFHGFGGIHVGFAPPRIASAITTAGIDESLEAERAIHYEAGFRAKPWRFLQAEGTLFLSNFDNQIIPSARNSGDTADLVNGGRTRHIGVELAGRFEAGRAFRWPLTVDVYASYTGLSATFASGAKDDPQTAKVEGVNGNTLPYAPEHTASAVLDVEHPIGLGAQVSYTFVGSQFADDSNIKAVDASGRIGEIPSHHVLDLAFRYTHKASGLGGTLAIKNALDDIYVASRRPDGIFPAGFRQILGTVRWTYDEGADAAAR